MKQNNTMMIKSKFSNAVHALINPTPVKNRDRWKQKKVVLSDAEKAALYDKIVALDAESTTELGHLWYERRERKRIEKARLERGHKAKKKTSKAEYEAMQQNEVTA